MRPGRLLFCMGLIGILICAAPAMARAAKTSKNSPRLKEYLKANPAADADKDGILTLEEGKKHRGVARKKKQKPKRGDEQKKKRGDRKNKERGDRPKGERPQKNAASAQGNPAVKYGEHKANLLSFWKAQSDKPTPLFVWIHGGGFRSGSRGTVPGDLKKRCLNSGISVASLDYRLSGVAPYPAQMHDCARAIQFLRSKAKEWNLDKKRFAAGGGSAGSGISQWLGFRDDMADPKSEDPIARESTRMSCVIPINMQCTYDPREIKKIVPGKSYQHSAIIQLHGLPEDWDWDKAKISEDLDERVKDASPLYHLTKDDCPAFIFSYERARKPGGDIHHPNFGDHLKKEMDKLGIENVRYTDKDLKTPADQYKAMFEFLQKHFGMIETEKK